MGGSEGALVTDIRAILDEAVAVVGAGVTGWSVIEAILEAENKTPIILITKASAGWYYQPTLSASFISDRTKDCVVMESAVSMAKKYAVILKNNTELIGIDRACKKLTTDAGLFAYGRLILASDSKSNELTAFKHKTLTVNDLNDLVSLTEKLASRKRIAIIGGGLIASEMDHDLNQAKLQVTMINQTDHHLQTLMPQTVDRP